MKIRGVFFLKKVISFLVMLTLVFTIVACGNDEGGDKKGAGDNEAVTIKYANWNLGTEEEMNLERLMIQAFEEEHPNINIEIDESIDPADWNGSLAAAASAGNMPDVFMLAQVPPAVANDWLLDLNDVTANDEDYANISEVVKESVTYNGKTVALPVAQHFQGFFVNKDLYNKSNLDYPEYGFDIDGFTSAVKSITDVNNGVVGLNNPFGIPDFYPSSVNENLGYFTYNDGKYELDSKEFISGINYTSSLINGGYTYATLTDEQKANFNGEDGNQVWQQSGIGLWWDGTWAVANFGETVDFEWDFVGVPGGRPIVINDFMGISKSTENAEEAYEFVKYMSFGKEGFLKRLEVADAEGKTVNTLPISGDQEVLDKYFEINAVPGIRLAYDNLDNAIIEPVKTVPGYTDSRWNAPTGVKIGDNPNANVAALIDNAMKGNVKIEDYAKQLDDLADQKYEEISAELSE
jgi:multiple sugar transport system substrate-binding protein